MCIHEKPMSCVSENVSKNIRFVVKPLLFGNQPCLVVEPTHLKKYARQIGSFPQVVVENKKYLKTPTSDGFPLFYSRDDDFPTVKPKVHPW